MTSFSAALDAWLTRDPHDGEPDILLPGDEGYPRCSRCGAFLKRDPDRAEGAERTEPCDGQPGDYTPPCGCEDRHAPHEYVTAAWAELHRTCGRCGHDNTEIAN